MSDKEPGQVAWEAWNEHISSPPDVRWAAIEAAVRAAALEEAAKEFDVMRTFRKLWTATEVAVAIRALSPSPAAPADK